MISTPDKAPDTGAPPVRGLKGLLAETGLYGLGNVLARFMGVISTAVLARILTVTQFGQLDFLMTLAGLAVILFSLRTEPGVIRLYHLATGEDRGRLLFSHLAGVSLIGLGMVPVTLVLAGPLVRLLAPGQMGAADPAWVAPILLSGLWFNHVVTALRTARRAGSAVAFSAGVALGQVALAIPLAAVWGVGGVLLARAVAEGVGSGLVIWQRRDHYSLRLSRRWLVRLVRFGLPLLPVALSQGVLNNFTRYLLIAFWGAATLGLFAVAFRVSLIVGVVVGALKTAWLPYAFSREENETSRQETRLVYASYLRVMAVVTVGVMIFAVDIIRVVAGAQYEAAAPVTGLLCMAVLLQGAMYFFYTPFWSRERTWPVMVGSLLGGAFAAVGSWLLVPRWGLPAAAAVQMTSNLMVVVVLAVWLRAQYRERLPFVWLLVLTAGVALFSWAAMTWLTRTSFWVRLGLGAAIGAASVLFLRAELAMGWAVVKNRWGGKPGQTVRPGPQ